MSYTLQEWLHHAFFSRVSLLGTYCSKVGPPWTLIPLKKVILCRFLSTVDSFFQDPHAEWYGDTHHGMQLLSGHIHVLQHGFLPWQQCRYLLWHSPPGAAGRQPDHNHLHSLHRNLCSSPSHPASLTLAYMGLFNFFLICLFFRRSCLGKCQTREFLNRRKNSEHVNLAKFKEC